MAGVEVAPTTATSVKQLELLCSVGAPLALGCVLLHAMRRFAWLENPETCVTKSEC